MDECGICNNKLNNVYLDEYEGKEELVVFLLSMISVVMWYTGSKNVKNKIIV